MNFIVEIVSALWHQDFSILADPQVIWTVYGLMFTILLLENGLLPAAFLPGDSLLILAGAMIAKGVMYFLPTLIILTSAASLGCWLGYIQGRWLSNTRLIKGWLRQLPEHYHQRARRMFTQHGLLALVIGRFLAFIRTLLPALAGISGLEGGRFQLFNWLSGVIWVGLLLLVGYGINQIPFIMRHQDLVMTILMLVPIVLLLAGLVGSLIMVCRKSHSLR